MKLFRIIFFIFLLLLPNSIEAQSQLHVVTLAAPPMVMVENDKITGMAVELATAGLRRAGFEPFIETAPWQRAVYMAQHGFADALFYAVYNEERARHFHYPDIPLFTIDLVALKRAENSMVFTSDYQGLSRWKIGIGRGFAYGPKLEKFLDRAKFKKIEVATSNELNFKKLMDSRIDILVADKALAHYLMAQAETPGKADFLRDENGEIVIIDQMEAYLVFSRKTSTAHDAQLFTDALESMKTEGTYQAIINKYQ